MTSINRQKQKTYYFGIIAENIAKGFLRLKGYSILATRYRNHAGEIDIIAKRRKTVAFIEVKARKNKAQLAEAITRKQQHRISRAASLYMAQLPASYQARFDVIFITLRSWPQHIPHAWEAPYQAAQFALI